MKISILTSQYGHYWSGLGTYATNLVNGLAGLGHKVTIISPAVSSQETPEGVKKVEVQGLPIKPTLGNWPILSYYYAKTLKSVLKQESYNIIHFVDARESLFCSVKGIPVFGTMHDYYFSEASANPLVYKRFYHDWVKRWAFYNLTKIFERKAVNKLSCLISNTTYVANSMKNLYGVKEERVETVHLGVHPDTDKGAKKSPGLEGDPAMLFIGGNFQRKGLPFLVRAVSELKKKLPHISLYVVGKDQQQGEIENLCAKHEVQGAVHFLGWKENRQVRALLRGCDVFCMPSLIEGFGLVFLEAMESGIPVIGSKTGGVPELIQSGENGFLVPPEDWRGIAEKIELLYKNKDVRETVIKNGFSTVKKFSVEKMVLKTEALYRKVETRFSG
ncbi:MAG: glycosyltransferase family 4 protein [Nitrospinota bacterium]